MIVLQQLFEAEAGAALENDNLEVVLAARFVSCLLLDAVFRTVANTNHALLDPVFLQIQ